MTFTNIKLVYFQTQITKIIAIRHSIQRNASMSSIPQDLCIHKLESMLKMVAHCIEAIRMLTVNE